MVVRIDEVLIEEHLHHTFFASASELTKVAVSWFLCEEEDPDSYLSHNLSRKPSSKPDIIQVPLGVGDNWRLKRDL